TTERCYVGFDVPYAPYPVNAEYCPEGIRVYWAAPDRGANWGAIDPAKTVYNVFRCWGYGENNRELIAENIPETEYVDNGAGMTAPLAVRYEVQAANNVGPGESNYSSYDYSLIIGPAYTLPFVETFDGGSDKMWSHTYSSYYARMYVAEEADYGDGTTVEPHTGDGLIYVNYSEYSSPSGTTNSMTSYKIDLSDAAMPALSYWYYAIPDNDVYIDVQLSTDGTEFTSVSKTLIALGADEATWKKVLLPLPDYAGKSSVFVRFVTGFSDHASSAIIDDIVLADYHSVGAVETESDPDKRTITLSWEDPGTEYTPCIGYKGYVDGESVGSVSMPWVFEAAEYGKTYTFSVEALYDGVEVAPSTPVSAVVEAPEISEFTVDDYTFVVDKSSKAPAVWVKCYTGSRSIITLPGGVNYMDVSYEVTAVLDGAFLENASVVSVVIPETYTTIGEEAFAGCPKLMGVTIGAGVTEIKARAFADCPALSQVLFMSAVPPVVAEDAFEGIAEGCKGTAPEGTAEVYAAVPGLSPIDFGVGGITDVEIETAANVEYFDLNGRHLDAPVRGGCTIVRLTARDGSVRTGKIALK
ncbi:MAG: leucine-rich repeat domain-containing protein, partial [Muribaculaceae bacterium]|nr:leucine-rich repeat domain-containing protein [Muribaculaceae bacterium]